MDEKLLIQTVNDTAKETGINPLLLLSGIEGLYTFKEVELSNVNHELLDSLILTIFALRIGDQFHSLAEENLKSSEATVLASAAQELRILLPAEIEASTNHYLYSFAKLVAGKAFIRGYHIKALEVSAMEIRKAQIHFSNNSIGDIVMNICKNHLAQTINIGALFQS